MTRSRARHPRRDFGARLAHYPARGQKRPSLVSVARSTGASPVRFTFCATETLDDRPASVDGYCNVEKPRYQRVWFGAPGPITQGLRSIAQYLRRAGPVAASPLRRNGPADAAGLADPSIGAEVYPFAEPSQP